MILETVTGTNGIIVPPDGYLQSIRETCDRHGILLIADEVMAGFGRTGKWFACDHWDVVPDIITMAKGINSGYVPLGAMAIREPIADVGARQVLRRRPHVQRASARVRVGVASIEAFREEGIVENAAAMGDVFREALARLASEASVDRRRARARLLLGARARQATARRASRSCRSTAAARPPRRWRGSRRRRSSAAST